MNPAALFLADASPRSGRGHVARCSAVALALRSRGLAARCIGLGADGPLSCFGVDWEPQSSASLETATRHRLAVLDSYQPENERPASALGQALAVMHDHGRPPSGADLVITSDPEQAGDRPDWVGGPRWSCLGPDFWGLEVDTGRAERPPRRVVVVVGSGDHGGHAVELARTAAAALPHAQVTLVRGPYADWDAPPGIELLDRPSSLLAAFLEHDVTVTSGGQLLYEALAAGIPTITVPVAENQRPGAGAVTRAGATEMVEPGDHAGLTERLGALADDPAERRRRVERGRELVDGNGALRVGFLLARLIAGGAAA